MPMLFSRPARIFRAALALLGALSAATPALAAMPMNTGEQKTAVVLVNFQDRAVQPFTAAAASNLVFGQVSDFYWEGSYQRTFFSGATFGWFTLPVSSTTCDVNLIAQEADRAATAAGANLAAYDRIVYLAPQNACTVSGYNNGPGVWPSRTWIVTDHPDVQLVAHELGHNFGLSHSQSIDCGPAVLGGSCRALAYGDVADTMGNGVAPQFNAFQKEKLGWLGAGGTPAVTTVAASGTYAIAPLETAGTAAKALKIPRGIDAASGQMAWYYVEVRQPVGFDAVLAAPGNLTAGVLVHTGGVGQPSVLLDMTPDSYAASSDDVIDAALVPGRRWTDAAGNTLEVRSLDASGASVAVTLAATPAPAAGVLDESLGTDKRAYLRGETVSMSALVRRDGVPLGGAQVAFTVVPASGAATTLRAVTGADGFARGTYRIGKAKAAIGTYVLRADATAGGASATVATSFAVR